ncbi:IBR domain-containing protein [Colletotrichum truncatum]|uniref:IBR domain-containing protein n=1 Tax=Colletotrichum truncatum TaxID=5467 RepID=A0ACC3YV07_COLTU
MQSLALKDFYMDHFQLLDEDVASLILRYGFLNVEALHVATADEVENAAALALQMAEPEELLAIAVRQSMGRNRHLQVSITARPSQQTPHEPEDSDSAAYINWQERNRLLADSPAESNNEAEQSGDDCIICSAGYEPKLRLPCGCWFCARCLRSCIRAGMRQGGWPPRCCEPLDSNTIEWVRRPDLMRLYRQVKEEHDVPGSQRVYCARPGCAAFIPPTGPHASGDLMRCPACGEGTCRLCKMPLHPGRPCREEEEDEMLMDIMDRDNLASCPTCRRVVELRDGCNHIHCECGHDWCFLCGGAWTPHGCEQSCPPYGGQDVRVPMRQRQFRYRQGRHERDNTQRNPSQLEPPALQALLPQIQGILPAEQQQIFVAPHPGQIELVNQPMQNIIVQPIPQAALQPVPQIAQPQPQPRLELFDNDIAGNPANFDPNFGGMLPLIPWDELPREARNIAFEPQGMGVEMAGRPAARGRRYRIILFYPDGRTPELGDANWRRDSLANRRRVLDGVEDEGRAWPEYAIEREDPGCRHQLHQQWGFQLEEDPPCFYCRLSDGRQLWRCRNCGATACDAHRFMRFGLTWDQATRFVDRLRRRVTVENDFRYPQANSAGIERWDLFFRRQRPRRGFWARLLN